MPTALDQAFQRLNAQQRKAVEQIDGPLLVIAGPGTGKTQLLSARVAYILQKTDTLPQNILCLTFTESGATNMRERLSSFIGQAAYDVTIGTYHAFGGELIGRFPQYFGEHRAQSAADALAQREIIQAIVGALPFSNPLKSTQHHLHDLLSTISEIKRGLLTEDDLRAIATDNLLFLSDTNEEIKEIFADFARMPSKADKALPYFENLLGYIKSRDQADYTLGSGTNVIKPLAHVVQYELEQAIAAGEGDNSTKPLTAWKNKWLEKDADNTFVLSGQRENQRIAALADVFRDYHQALEERDLYDFDDMILRSIKALEVHDDLRFTLHEQYQYIMLDEFQDTNAAQLKLIRLLTNNPVSEGRPNVMAVGDDDQAIYAFQGAEVSNMLEFAQMYRDTKVINLTDNYRSHPEILHVAHEVAQQIGTRLENSFDDMSKILTAANKDIAPEAHIDRHEFQADVGQYDWIANRIAELIKQGTPASEIAVLAPRHKQLEPLVAYLNRLEIPVRYEKRENILEAPVVLQLLAMTKLITALQQGNASLADALWPEVLSYNFWQLPTSAIWQLSWKVRDSKYTDEPLDWSQAVLADEQFRVPGLIILTLAKQAATETLEVMMDRLIGSDPVVTGEDDIPKTVSPLKTFYMGQESRTEGPDLFYQTMSHLTCLRAKLRDHQNSQDDPLQLHDLLNLVQLYEAAGERMLNTSPYNQHAEAVQLMTVFKAKGLEFEHVFLPSVQDEVWGESSRSQSNRLTLPPNLAPIRPAGTTQDERLRIFFVAVTRAKLGLHMTSYLQTYSGRSTKRLRYLNEQPDPNNRDGFKTLILPAERQDVKRIDNEVPELGTLELNWRQHHMDGLQSSELKALLQSHIQDFQLTASMLCCFTDLIYGGPEAFFFQYLLRFPGAPSDNADYGTAFHETLQWIQLQVDDQDNPDGYLPAQAAIHQYFEARLKRRKLRAAEHLIYLQRGKQNLQIYLKDRSHIFRKGHKAEYSFGRENVVVDNVKLTGKIDLMEVDQHNKTITVVDYKTGAPYSSWKADPKLHKYRHQLYCYKLLIEHSRTFKDYKVHTGRLEFVEPDDNGRIHTLELTFDDKELTETTHLLQAIWQTTYSLQLPNTTQYDQTLTGIKQFEADLRQQ